MSRAAGVWRSVSFAMVLGTAGYAGFIANDMIAFDSAHGGHEPEATPVAGAAMAQSLAAAGEFGLGRVATPDEIHAWDIDVRPDGQGLPPGEGSVEEGELLYENNCAVCHGAFGEGEGRWPVLAGGAGTLSSDRPVKTVGSYWPYLSTVYDYVHRAMPFGAAQSLSDDGVYAITAYILYLNDLVDDDFVLSKENFTEFRMPNEANFYMDDRDSSPVGHKTEVCMSDCKTDVTITARARVIDVTPEDGSEPGEETVEKLTLEAGGSEAPVAPVAAEETAAAPAAIDAALAAEGETVFKKCRSCHQVGEGARHRTGPILNGIVGRTIGSVDGFKKYSKKIVEMGGEGVVWDDATLDEFLARPKDFIKGTRMSFAGLRDEEDRAAVIEYLKQFAE